MGRRNRIIIARILVVSIVVLGIHFYQQGEVIEVAANPVEME